MSAESENWRAARKAGAMAIAGSMIVTALLWLAILYFGPSIQGIDTVSSRMIFALKCCCVAVLFCLVMGVEAVAHERLQSPAFDPLAGHETRRLRVNLRFLQNTLEQFVVFAFGLFGLAAYADDELGMRAVLATTVVWILTRFAFWIGYHHSAAMRGLGAPGMMVSMLALIYVVCRVSFDIAGWAGVVVFGIAFAAIEALLFLKTRQL
ncbi:hypothetical protein O9Z70_05715 [Devosia sp. YIM 151766]|uniref:MAPEG family protein n=1 Tax=Devosia sp. YIM 151766 TaxID=3017325 RepID=UPI00255CCD30|nr:MAPEG family protein [Devosia sp. YIM 151766]WIY54024.1 hypothetical protein O9Z70_05715 [Devosia sp. YIM 151766]